MAKTVITAFDEFMKNTVNLDTEISNNAKSSRDWLIEQIDKFKNNDERFPSLHKEFNINFGSFDRKTKIRELDDIDIMIGLNAQSSTYAETDDKIEINVSIEATDLLKLCYDNTNKLNSKKIINKFVDACANVPQYSRSEIKRNQEAAVLNLTSYEWSFDIVPCFKTAIDMYGRDYYLIPDGNGNWKKTDPRIDKERITTINQKHDGNILQVIRAIKYWNKRHTMPTMPSYLLEVMILNYYENYTEKASKFVDLEIINIFYYLYNNIMNDVYDPKNIQGNINNLTYDEKSKIKNKSYDDYIIAKEARKLEVDKNMEDAINKWRNIFGDSFPEYE